MKQAMADILFLNYCEDLKEKTHGALPCVFTARNAYAAAPQINGSRTNNRTTQMHAQSAITLHKKTRSRF